MIFQRSKEWVVDLTYDLMVDPRLKKSQTFDFTVIQIVSLQPASTLSSSKKIVKLQEIVALINYEQILYLEP